MRIMDNEENDTVDDADCPTSKYPRGSIRSDGTHRDLPGKTGNRNNDLPGSPGPYWWS